MATYKWASPHEWLHDQLESWDRETLKTHLKALCRGMESNYLQGYFEPMMDETEYFVDLDAPTDDDLTDAYNVGHDAGNYATGRDNPYEDKSRLWYVYENGYRHGGEDRVEYERENCQHKNTHRVGNVSGSADYCIDCEREL